MKNNLTLEGYTEKNFKIVSSSKARSTYAHILLKIASSYPVFTVTIQPDLKTLRSSNISSNPKQEFASGYLKITVISHGLKQVLIFFGLYKHKITWY